MPSEFNECETFPELCQQWQPEPYIQKATFLDVGFSTSNYLILRDENSKKITLHGHNLNFTTGTICVLGDHF